MEIQDFHLKYDTVVMAHVYVSVNQDLTKLQKNVIRAASGPQLHAIAAWTEMCIPGQKPGDEVQSFGDQRAAVEEFFRNAAAAKSDIAVFHLCINTDTDPTRLGENIQRAARGPRFDDVMCVILHYTGGEGRKVWDLIQQVVVQAHASSTAQPFTL